LARPPSFRFDDLSAYDDPSAAFHPIKMHPKLFAAVAALAIGYSGQLCAQETDTTTHLGTVVVSASKVPRPASTLTQAVTVLRGEDLRARGVMRVADALREVPGAMLVQNGSYGAATSLFLRGGESRYTKVLIDGIAINTSGGAVDLSNLTTDNIDRIEIVRGPASVLYGADAVSGIVQIFTRKAVGEPRASIGLRAGSYRAFDADANASLANSNAGVSLGAAHHSTSGVLPFNNGYRNGTLSSALSLGNASSGDATFTARYTSAEFHFPTDFAGRAVDTNSYSAEHRLTFGLDAGRTLTQFAQARFLAGANEVSNLSEDITTPFGASEPVHSAFASRGSRRTVESRLSLFLPSAATLTLGGSYERQAERSSNATGPVGEPATPTDSFDAARSDVAYYSELLGNPANWISYSLSGRVDDNSDYRRAGTYRIGLALGDVHTLRLRASSSTAFNAPAFSQLRPTLYTVGSPRLKPERAKSSEVGITSGLNTAWAQLNVNYFTQRFADLIQYIDGAPPDFKGSYANLARASSDGYEGQLDLFPSSELRASVSFTVVDPRITEISPSYQGPDAVGDALIRRPSHSGSAVVTYARPSGGSLGVAFSFVGKRPDIDFTQFPSPRVTLPAYTKIDLSGDLPIAAIERTGLTLDARVENLLNKRYEDVLNFRTPGRTILIGARATRLF
jgi:vitamin B12 transporter